ncbi:MAG: hypothetical protein KatS3mg014_0792 [Actinomycetota bacterium]|nr:MAG: hypothetical protein KatS3mg014_0792 [Actinomycetota bacterium]
MKTGEGKTLVSTLPVYLNAPDRPGRPRGDGQRLPGPPRRGVDGPDLPGPRAQRGSSSGQRRPASSAPAYAADVTYGTNNEFGFDYLRDNMALRSRDMVQRGHHYAIVDEVDSILIDEARTPLIISGASERLGQALLQSSRRSPGPARDVDYEVDEEKKTLAADREGDRQGRAVPRDREPLRRTSPPAWSTSCRCAHQGQGALQARPGLHRPGRRGEDRRRVHRPGARGPALVRGPAPGDRGQGGGARSRRRTRPSPRSPSRTTSGCTRSSPA